MEQTNFHHTWIISPVGTSLLTNGASREMGELLRRTANSRRQDYEPADLADVEERVATVRVAVHQASRRELVKMSAELNGIMKLEAANLNFSHYLLCTNTFQGEKAAEIVQSCLQNLGVREAWIQKIEA